MSSTDFHNYAKKLRQDTSKKPNKDPDTLMPSRRTMRRSDKNLGIRDTRAEATTLARELHGGAS